MTISKQIISFLVSIIFLAGCATISSGPENSKGTSQAESRQDVETAVVAITDAIKQKGAREKYCPVCGKHFSGHLKNCPKCNVPLNEVE